MKKILGALYWIILVVVVLVVAALFLSNGKTPINYRVYSVESGSMHPAIPVGSVVMIMPQTRYAKGDIVTFRSETDAKRTVTHRVVEVERDDDIGKLLYQTKGDANEDPDMEKIDHVRVLGKVTFTVPLFGYVVSFAKTQIGFIMLVVIPATLIIYSELVNIIAVLKKKLNKPQAESMPEPNLKIDKKSSKKSKHRKKTKQHELEA